MRPNRRARTLAALPGLRPEGHVVDARMAWHLGADAMQVAYRTLPWWKRLACGSWRVPVERPEPPIFGAPLVFSSECPTCGKGSSDV